MKTFLISLALISLVFFTNKIFSQTPQLGTTSGFAFFTEAGAFTNVGASNITGNIGTNVGAFTGFPPGIVNGKIHVADPVTAQAAIDVRFAYNQLLATTCNVVLLTALGSNQTLLPGVYCLGAASTLKGNLILDAANDTSAIFIIQIDGAITTSPFANIVLQNGASIWNVFWQINEEFILGESSTFRGTVIANGALTLLDASRLYGRGLSIAGAVNLHNVLVNPDLLVLPIKIASINASNTGSYNQINLRPPSPCRGSCLHEPFSNPISVRAHTNRGGGGRRHPHRSGLPLLSTIQ
jgi:hypothetical protein